MSRPHGSEGASSQCPQPSAPGPFRPPPQPPAPPIYLPHPHWCHRRHAPAAGLRRPFPDALHLKTAWTRHALVANRVQPTRALVGAAPFGCRQPRPVTPLGLEGSASAREAWVASTSLNMPDTSHPGLPAVYFYQMHTRASSVAHSFLCLSQPACLQPASGTGRRPTGILRLVRTSISRLLVPYRHCCQLWET